MNAPGDPWHYARAELAQKYLTVFELGLTSAKGLFAAPDGEVRVLEKGSRCFLANAGVDWCSTPKPSSSDRKCGSPSLSGLRTRYPRRAVA